MVVANVAPGAGSVRETLSTLGFAQRAKQARPPPHLATQNGAALLVAALVFRASMACVQLCSPAGPAAPRSLEPAACWEQHCIADDVALRRL